MSMKNLLNIILLSGGSGKRLWPLSNDVRSKQFIPIFKREDGIYESMVQRVFRQISYFAEGLRGSVTPWLRSSVTPQPVGRLSGNQY